MGRLGVVQLDSIPVVIRTQYMPFHSRLGPYRASLLDEIAYRDDEWFEAWAHEASLLPVESEPSFRWQKERARRGDVWKSLARVAAEEPEYLQAVLDEVRERGTVTGGELSDPRPIADNGTGWWSRSLGVLALDWLFRVGELGIRRQGNFEKAFSPLDKIVPARILARPTPAVEDAQRELVLRSVQGLGVGTADDVADYFRLPITEVRLRLAELVEDGTVIPAAVKGWDKPAFADPEAPIPRSISGTTVLSPFDPVVWHRERAHRLFGFEYRIEVYVPAAKRRWGYYVLPVMVDGRIVARVDAKTDRTDRVLRIKSAHAEPGMSNGHCARQVRLALDDLARFVEVDEVVIEPKGDLAPLLV